MVNQPPVNATFSTLSRRQTGIIANSMGSIVNFSHQQPPEAMQAIANHLRAKNAGG